MEGIIKWLAIGGVAYFIYYELTQPGGMLAPATATGTGAGLTPAVTAATGTVTTPAVSTTGQTAPTGGTGVATSNTKATLASLASADGTYQAQGGKLSYDQWNYFLQKIIPSPIIAWENTGAASSARSTLWNIDQFWGFVNPKGISGMGRLFESANVRRIRTGGGLSAWERRFL